MTPAFDPARIAEETAWLIANPQFEEKPASITEFLGEDYLNIEKIVRVGLKKALVDLFGEEVNVERLSKFERAMITGGIGIGKTTFASIALPYMAHYVLCMKNPQEYFSLMPGSRIAFMQMSTSAKQASEVVFGDLFARIKNSKWFVDNYPYDQEFSKQIRFPQKDIWILPGGSAETAFEGYNILAGIIDEMDSHQITDQKDYADVGFDTIHTRIASRFTDFGIDGDESGHLGLLICIGQMKKNNGFAARKFKEFEKDPKAYTMRMTLWESFGWDKYTRRDGTRASFWYDSKSKKIVPDSLAGLVINPNLIEVPVAYKQDFMNNPEKALRDLAGIPPAVASPFISMVDKIEACRDRWVEHFNQPSPVGEDPNRVQFEPWFAGNGDPRKRVMHLDFGLTRDAMGIAMGHVDRLVEREGELQPYIVIDCIIRIKAFPGQQVVYSDVRRVIYQLKDDLNFRLKTVTMDGFQSTDTQQQLRKRKFHVEDLSADKSMMPYEDLRDAIYDERLEFPPYMTFVQPGDAKTVEIAIQELMQLQDMGKKVDHPAGGSKDVADALAGVVTTLMGDRTYRRGVASPNRNRQLGGDGDLTTQPTELPNDSYILPGLRPGLEAPGIPAGFGLSIPARLQPSQNRRV